MLSQRPCLRHALVSLSFVLLYLFLNKPEVIFISRIGFVTWYPAIGLVVALLLGVSPWYALLVLFADALAARIIYGTPVLSFSSTVGSLGSALCYGTAAYILRGPLQIDLGLRRRRDVVRYVVVGAAAVAGATIFGVACLIADRSISWHESQSSGISWFLGDAIGLVGIAPFLLVHVFPHVRSWLAPTPLPARPARAFFHIPKITFGPFLEACVQASALFAVLLVMFGSRDPSYPYFYLSFVPIIWIAMRQGIRRAVTGLLLINFGIVIAMHIFPPTAVVFTKIALLMTMLSVVGLIVGSEVSERYRLAIDLHRQTTYLDSLIQNSPLGIIVLDRQGAVELVNSAFEKLFQYDRHELISRIVPADEASDSSQVIRQVFAGRTVHKIVRQQRMDGETLDLALHGVPLLVTGEVRGAYLIYEDVSEQARASAAQREHGESLDRLVRELELRTMQTVTLNEMGSLLACSGAVKEACDVVAMSMRKLLPDAPSGAVYLFRSSRDILEAGVRWGKVESLAPTFPPEACWCLRRGQPHWCGVPENDIACQHLTLNSNAESLCLPMVAQGNTIGVLQLQFEMAEVLGSRSDKEIRNLRERLAVTAASHIALSLASLQLRETLREQSIRDPLTRLFNRRFLEESLVRELQLAARNRQSISVLFLDLDYFKKFNDAFGHDAGDMVLQALADLFNKFFRATDICCRFGGEEFAVVMTDSSAKDAYIRAEAFRLEVNSLRLQYKKQPVGPLTVSIGVAAFPDHASTSEGLLKIADQCLYESKARGRNVVTQALPQNV